MIGIVANIEGNLLGGHVDEKTAAKFATKFVDAGLLATEIDGSLPSAGRVAVAMDRLIIRLRFALGEYDSEPEPAPEATAHMLLFPTEAQAVNCKNDLLDSATDIHIEPHPAKPGWQLYAGYPELAPDSGFLSRERELQATARRFGGVYSGSQGPPS
jgi:hypothetical protein